MALRAHRNERDDHIDHLPYATISISPAFPSSRLMEQERMRVILSEPSTSDDPFPKHPHRWMFRHESAFNDEAFGPVMSMLDLSAFGGLFLGFVWGQFDDVEVLAAHADLASIVQAIWRCILFANEWFEQAGYHGAVSIEITVENVGRTQWRTLGRGSSPGPWPDDRIDVGEDVDTYRLSASREDVLERLTRSIIWGLGTPMRDDREAAIRKFLARFFGR